ncbi:hypothetical protein V8F44DRAFT_586640 [Aspergillus fumigatus]
MTILRISASIAPVSHYCRGPVAFTPKARISHRTSLRTFTGYTRPPFLSGATRSVVSTTHCSFAITTLPTMADSKGRKQATLGYVRDSQLTLGCVV